MGLRVSHSAADSAPESDDELFAVLEVANDVKSLDVVISVR